MPEEMEAEVRFAVVPEWLIYAVSPTALKVYAVLARFSDSEHRSFPSRRTIGDRIERGLQAVDNALSELVDAGAVTVEKRSKDGVHQSNLYTIRVLPPRQGGGMKNHARGGMKNHAGVVGKIMPRTKANERDTFTEVKVGTLTRGTRLPDSFEITPEMREWAATTTPDVDPDSALEEFRDYWTAVPGARGVKRDWIATWRNDMRRKQQLAPKTGTPTSRAFHQAQAVIDDYEREGEP